MALVAGGLRTSGGTRLELAEQLGRGGEARVHAVRGDDSSAVKIYAVPDAERARKLAAMIARAPVDPDRKAGHVSIAWPRELVLGDDGRVVGFVMPRIDARRYLPLHQLYHPGSRRTRAAGISWRYMVRIARNLCGAVAALHDADYVVGDLNESNVLVDDRALVTLVDLDSIQVTSGFRTFRCNVGKGEYTPPELQDKSFRDTNRKATGDRFGLAVLIFLLLMEGNHPFAGSYRGEGEPPSLEENIRARRSPYFGRGRLEPPLAAPPIELLGPELSALLRRGLLGQPWRRPDARELKDALAELEEELIQCGASPAHAYGGHLDSCPWCERAVSLGRDPFPTVSPRTTPGVPANGGITPSAMRPGRQAEPAKSAPSAVGSTATHSTLGNSVARKATRSVAGFRGSWAQFHRRLPLLSLSLLVLLAVPTYLWRMEIRSLFSVVATTVASQYAALALLVALPALAFSSGLYRRARHRSGFARALIRLERVARAAVAACLMSLLASLAAGLFLGRGSVFAGDWLLLPSFWIVTFVVSLRFVGPRRF